jgi:thioredoxin reductase
MWDVLIVGAGPAGLSAALLLGRCRRRVLVCDAGEPRNAKSRALHGFLSRDGIAPPELLQLGRDQLRPYESVELRSIEVRASRRAENCFESTLADGTHIESRMMLLATGVRDELPGLAGIESCYGRSVLHCPYCDGWEWRDQPLAVYGRGKSGAELSLTVSLWSRDVVLCSDGPAGLRTKDKQQLKLRGIAVRQDRVLRLDSTNGMLERIVFEKGDPLPSKAMFTATHQVQRSSLPEQLGCEDKARRSVPTGQYEVTHVPGLFVAGDASRDVQLAIVAAAEGAQAAFAMNKALLKHDLESMAGKP